MNFFDYYNNIQLNYLDENVSLNNFDWDLFFEKYSDYLIAESITEPILTKSEKINNRIHLEYEFALNDYLLTTIADVIKCKEELDPIKQDIVKHEMEKITTAPLKELEEGYLKNLDNYVIKFQFRDNVGNTKLTNRFGNLAYDILKNASKTFLSTISKIEFDNVFCFELHILKTESRRLDIYEKMIQRSGVKDSFPNNYVDKVTDKNYITYYRWKNLEN